MLLQRFVVVAIHTSVVLAAVRNLVPVSKRTALLRARSLASDTLVLKNRVTISYGEENFSSSQVHSADLTLNARDGEPIGVVEEFEHLLKDVSCTSGSMTAVFKDPQMAAVALREWSKTPRFVLVTAHAEGNCNPENDRAAFQVSDVKSTTETTLQLAITRKEMHRVVKTMTVSLDHHDHATYAHELVRRKGGYYTIFDEKVNRTIPISIGGPQNRTQLWPISTPGSTGEVKDGLQVHCIGCRVEGNILIKAELYVDTSAAELIVDADDNGEKDSLRFKTAYLQVSMEEELKAVALFEFSLTNKTTLPEITVPAIPPFGLVSLALGSVLTIGPYAKMDVVMNLAAEATNANFTYGSQFSVPKGAVAKIDFTDVNKLSSAPGWDTAGVQEIKPHFNTLEGSLTITGSITPRLELMMGIIAGNSKLPAFNQLTAGVGAGIFLDLPKLEKTWTVVKDVGAECTPKADADKTYFGYGVKQNSSLTFAIGANSFIEAGAAEGKSRIRDRIDMVMAFLNQKYSTTLYDKKFDVGKETCLTYEEKVNPVSVKAWSDKEMVDAEERGVAGVNEARKERQKELEKEKEKEKSGGVRVRPEMAAWAAVVVGAVFYGF